jgi:hypothetical protein
MTSNKEKIVSGKSIHTSGNRKDGYINTEENVQIGPRYKTLKEAKIAGRELARANKSEHFIHNKEGLIVERNSYGNDPITSKG